MNELMPTSVVAIFKKLSFENQIIMLKLAKAAHEMDNKAMPACHVLSQESPVIKTTK